MEDKTQKITKYYEELSKGEIGNIKKINIKHLRQIVAYTLYFMSENSRYVDSEYKLLPIGKETVTANAKTFLVNLASQVDNYIEKDQSDLFSFVERMTSECSFDDLISFILTIGQKVDDISINTISDYLYVYRDTL